MSEPTPVVAQVTEAAEDVVGTEGLRAQLSLRADGQGALVVPTCSSSAAPQAEDSDWAGEDRAGGH